jgi:hypothetical protein
LEPFRIVQEWHDLEALPAYSSKYWSAHGSCADEITLRCRRKRGGGIFYVTVDVSPLRSKDSQQSSEDVTITPRFRNDSPSTSWKYGFALMHGGKDSVFLRREPKENTAYRYQIQVHDVRNISGFEIDEFCRYIALFEKNGGCRIFALQADIAVQKGASPENSIATTLFE